MKKITIITAAVIAFSFATPQLAKAMQVKDQMAIVQDKDATYKEIKAEELPEAVTTSIENAYTGYKIDKAFVGSDNTYKVKVAMGDLKYHLFYDSMGELIKVEDPTSKADDQHMNKSMNPANKSELPTDPMKKAPVK